MAETQVVNEDEMYAVWSGLGALFTVALDDTVLSGLLGWQEFLVGIIELLIGMWQKSHKAFSAFAITAGIVSMGLGIVDAITGH
jgi:uncharacterized membrane protein HdeD (DUF308 family)